MASTVLRFRSSKVCIWRSRKRAVVDGVATPNPPVAMDPSSATLIFTASGCGSGPASTSSKNALPRLFVAHGPVKRV